jgi:GT2 family glycosyltransferase
MYPDGKVNDCSFFMRPTLWSEIMRSLGAHRLAPASRVLNPERHFAYRSSNSPLEVDAIARCFIVLDRQLFEHLGGYDEQYVLSGEDLDLGVRAGEAGAAPAVVPCHPIIHCSAESSATRANAGVAYLRGRAQYQRRWWPARRAALAAVIRTFAVLARVLSFQILRSPRRDEFAKVWISREQWSSSMSLRHCSYRATRHV